MKEIASVFDISFYILNKLGSMTTMKLHKLIYYCQAWSLVWEKKPLFKEGIEAWSNGPIVRELYDYTYYKGLFNISSIDIDNINILNTKEKENIKAVLDYYGDKSSQELSDIIHMEDPWKKTRADMYNNERGDKVIELNTIEEYYTSLF